MIEIIDTPHLRFNFRSQSAHMERSGSSPEFWFCRYSSSSSLFRKRKENLWKKLRSFTPLKYRLWMQSWPRHCSGPRPAATVSQAWPTSNWHHHKFSNFLLTFKEGYNLAICTVCIRNLDKFNYIWWLCFRPDSIFGSVQVTSNMYIPGNTKCNGNCMLWMSTCENSSFL